AHASLQAYTLPLPGALPIGQPAALHRPGDGAVRLPGAPVGGPQDPVRVVGPVHDDRESVRRPAEPLDAVSAEAARDPPLAAVRRSEEHTSELQSRENLVCRL